jgi:hypothetical protein
MLRFQALCHRQWLLEYRSVDDPINDCTSDSNTGDSNEGEEVKTALATESTQSAINKSMKVIRISDIDFDKLYNPNEPFVEEARRQDGHTNTHNFSRIRQPCWYR